MAAVACCWSYLVVVATVVLPLLLLGVIGVSRAQLLQVGFYSDSCPDAEATVAAAVQDAAANDPTILPALLRLQFHDCFVKGCDASVLIRSASNDAEVDNGRNQGLRGQEVVDAAKAQLEDQCPGVVSCADIIALAARDAVAMTGGPSFDVPTGRRDGLTSNLRDADVLPDAGDSISVLRSRFAASGLDDRDLVLLTGRYSNSTLHVYTWPAIFTNDTGRSGAHGGHDGVLLREGPAVRLPAAGRREGGGPFDPGAVPGGAQGPVPAGQPQRAAAAGPRQRERLRRLHPPEHPLRPRRHRLRRRAGQQQRHPRARRRVPAGPLGKKVPARLRGRHGQDGQHRRRHRGGRRRGQGRLLRVQCQLIRRVVRRRLDWIGLVFKFGRERYYFCVDSFWFLQCIRIEI
uniref:Peroxidase n=1 Tax=Zea mays TaxID=4577 RepID=A0A804N6G4_MAIZE